MKNSKLIFWTSLLGNVLDHYDSALYAFLAPFLAPVFFPELDPFTGLILTFSLKLPSFVIRPLGAILFGNLAYHYPPLKILLITLLGVAFTTFFISIIPGYSVLGYYATLIFVILRSIQGLFASGEHTIAALFVLEHAPTARRYSSASSYYLCSTMAGTLLASIATTIVSQTTDPSISWRYAYAAGLFTAVVALFIRYLTFNRVSDSTPLQSPSKSAGLLNLKILAKRKLILTKIIFASSFSFITYSLPFIFLNNFIPLLTNFKIEELLTHNNILLAIDILLLPIFGNLSEKFNTAGWMSIMAGLLAITIIPIFYLLPYLNIIQITVVKFWIMILGVAFVAPLNALIFKMLQGDEKYLLSGFGYAIGTELLGRNVPLICLTLWKSNNSLFAPACYIASISLITTIILIIEYVRSKKEDI